VKLAEATTQQASKASRIAKDPGEMSVEEGFQAYEQKNVEKLAEKEHIEIRRSGGEAAV